MDHDDDYGGKVTWQKKVEANIVSQCGRFLCA